MLNKKVVKTFIVGSAILCFCSLSFAIDSTGPVPKQATDTLRQLTIEELAKYDGKNGHPGYVAIDSVIYDVSFSDAWKNGEHKMGLRAGNDLSKFIMKSPHGKIVLKKLKVVGKLIPSIKKENGDSVRAKDATESVSKPVQRKKQ